MSLKTFATLALATGFAAAKPISAPQSKRNNNVFGNGFNGAVVNGFNGNGFNFIDNFNNFNQQQQVLQIQEQNLQIQDNGFQQQVVQQVNQVLVVDQVNNGFNNDLANVFRKTNLQNQFGNVATVMMVVQEIQVAVDNGFGGQFQQNVFAQSVVVANRGAAQTQSIMIFDSKTLVAQDILANNAFGNIQQFGGVAGATGVFNNALPTKTAGIQLFGAKPTWTAVAQDPAQVLGAIWQGAIQDIQKNEFDQADNQINEQLAAQEKQKLDQAQQDQQNKDQAAKDQQAKDQAAQGQQNNDQAAQDQAAKDQAAQDQAAKDQQKAAEGQNQNQDQAKQGEKKTKKD